MKPLTRTPLLGLAIFSLSFASLNAATVFSDDFESPNVSTTYTIGNTSQQINTSKWVRSTNNAGGGFNGHLNGIVDEARVGESFADPTGSQAWAGRYTSNTGLTSAFQQIGTLAVGQTITISFSSVIDGYNSGSSIAAYLVVFDGSGTRNAVQNPETNTFAVLDRFLGTATGSYATYSFSYTVGEAVIDNNGGTSGVSTIWNTNALSKDIAIRFAHRNGALVDNVSVDITTVPEPAAALLGGLGLLVLLRRRRY